MVIYTPELLLLFSVLISKTSESSIGLKTNSLVVGLIFKYCLKSIESTICILFDDKHLPTQEKWQFLVYP